MTFWSDPRFVWVAFGAGAVAMVMSAALFAAIVWFVMGRHEHRSAQRLKAAEGAAAEAKRYAGQVAAHWSEATRRWSELEAAVNDHAEHLAVLGRGHAKRVRQR